MKRQILWMFTIFLLFIVLIFPAKLLAQPYYAGKTVTIIVGYAPGGGYDRMARLLAIHLPKYIPGNPTIIIQNMPGASSMITANHLYNIAKPDGLTIGTFNRVLPFAQLMKVEGLRFDLAKYSWIGSAAMESTVFTIRSDLPYKTFNELLKVKEPINLGGTGAGSTDTQFALLLKEFVGLKTNIITYPSGADIMLALERKELDGRAATYSSMKPYIERGLVRPLLRGRASEPGIENLPINEDFTTDKKGKTIMVVLSATDQVGRPYVAPPGTPPEIMKILREAFAKVAKDPELKEDAKKAKMEVEYVSAEESLKVVNYVLSQPEDMVKELSKYVKF